MNCNKTRSEENTLMISKNFLFYVNWINNNEFAEKIKNFNKFWLLNLYCFAIFVQSKEIVFDYDSNKHWLLLNPWRQRDKDNKKCMKSCTDHQYKQTWAHWFFNELHWNGVKVVASVEQFHCYWCLF